MSFAAGNYPKNRPDYLHTHSIKRKTSYDKRKFETNPVEMSRSLFISEWWGASSRLVRPASAPGGRVDLSGAPFLVYTQMLPPLAPSPPSARPTLRAFSAGAYPSRRMPNGVLGPLLHYRPIPTGRRGYLYTGRISHRHTQKTGGLKATIIANLREWRITSRLYTRIFATH